MYALADNYYKKDIDKKVYNVGIYLRLSREDENSIQSESIINQKEYLTQHVLEQEWNLIDIYTDDGYTGTDFNRPDFQRLIKDIESKRINLVITKDLSRLGRDYIETGYYLERYFPEKSVRYIALNDGIDTFEMNSSNNDMSPFKSVMNDMYAKDISKKVRTTINSKRKNGQFIGSFAPYGYVKSKEDKNRIIIDQEVAPIVKKIFDLYLEGNGIAHIAYILNSEGIASPLKYKTQKGNYKNPNSKLGLWGHETIKQILGNPTNTGSLAQNKYIKVNYKVKKLKTIPKESWIIVENTHEPIIDSETFMLVQEMLEKKAVNDCSTKKYEHILTGLVYCVDCGERMTFTTSHKKEKYCICSKYKRFKMCTRHSIRESELEKFVLNDLREISRYLTNKDKLIKLAKEQSKNTGTSDVVKETIAVEMRLADIKRTIRTLYEDKLKGILAEQDFIDMSQDYNKEREQLNTRLSKLNKKAQESQHNENQSDRLTRLVMEFSEFKEVTKPILAKLIDKIEVFEDKRIKIHYKFKKPY